MILCFVYQWYGDHRDLHVLTRSFPTRRSPDLEWRWAARKTRLWRRFRLPCPLDRSATYPLGFSGKPFATVGLGGERAAGALWVRHIPNKPKRAGVDGSSWGCRVGGTLYSSGAAKGREPAGAEPPRGGPFLP